MYIDPMNDSPSNLIAAMQGWLAWEDHPQTYRGELTQLREMLDYIFENMPTEEEEEERRVQNAVDRELLEKAKAEQAKRKTV